MACNICQKYDPTSIGQFLPIIEVSAGVVRSSTPTVYLESGNLRSNFWQERLLNGARNLKIVFNLLQSVLGVSFTKCGFDMPADLGATPAASPPMTRSTKAK